jgi:hypothetical protein
MSMLRERTTGFGGGMNDSASSADDYAVNQCELLYNGRPERDNTAGCVGGSRLLSLTPGAITTYGRGIVEFLPNSGTRELVKFPSTSGNTTVVYSVDSGKTWAAVATLNAIDGDWSFTTMSKGGTNYLLGAVGAPTMYSYSGGGASGWATLTGPVANCKQVAVHNERLWTFPSGSTVYASKIADFSTWAAPDGLVLPVQTHDGENLTAIKQAGPILLLLKRHSAGYTDGFGEADIIVAAGSRGLSASIGCIAPRTFQAVGRGYVWQSERGLEFFDGTSIQPIAVGGLEYISGIARNRITEATGTGSTPNLPCSVYWPEREEYWIAWPSETYESTDTTAVNDEGLILNVRTGAVARRVWNPPDNTGSRKLHPGAMCLAEVTVDNRSFVRPVVLTKYGELLAMDVGTFEQVGLGDVPVLTSPLLILDADREAWSLGLVPGESADINGATLTDYSGEGNDCTASILTLIHTGTKWVFRFPSEAPFGGIEVPATDLTAGVATIGVEHSEPDVIGDNLLIDRPIGGGAGSLYLYISEYGGVARYLTLITGTNNFSSFEYADRASLDSSHRLIVVMDESQAEAGEIVTYVDGVLSPPAFPGEASSGPAGGFGNQVALIRSLTGIDVSRITIQAAAISGAELVTLDDFLENGMSVAYDIDFRVRTRLHDFSEPGYRKWARMVRITATESADQTVTVIPMADGTSGASQTVNFTAATNDKPLHKIVRPSMRGLNHQVEIRGSGGLKISAVELQARLMRGVLY